MVHSRTLIILLSSILLTMILALVLWSFVFPQFSANLPVTDQNENLDESIATSARIIQRGYIRVGVKYDTEPFGFMDEQGEVIGFDIDLAREFAQRWLNDPEAVELIRVTSADRIPRLTSGDIDIILAALPIQRERDALVDFSQTYFMGGQGLLVKASSSVNSLADLQNRSIGTIQASIWSENLQRAANQLGIAIQMFEYQDYNSAVDALILGQVEAVTADSVTLTKITQGTDDLRLLNKRINPEPYGIGVRQGDSPFRQMVDFTLQDMKREGIYDTIYRKWFTGDMPYAMQIAAGERQYTLQELPSEMALGEQSKFQQISERGRLIAGIHPNLAPLSELDDSGQLVGFDTDLVREFARRWLGDANAVELVSRTPENESIDGYDLIAGVTYQREQAMAMDFSQTYLGPPLANAFYHFGLPPQQATFRELVNVTLQEMKADGTYDQFYKRWFGVNAPSFALEILPGTADYLQAPYTDQEAGPREIGNQPSVIRRIRERENRMKVGVRLDRSPFSYQNANDELTGFDIDILRAIAQELDVSLDLVPITPFDYVDKLVTGNVDLVATALVHNRQDEGLIEFSESYFVDGQGLMVRRDSDIDSLHTLDGRVVGVFQGSAALEQIQAYADANGLQIELIVFGDYASALDALNKEELDALSASNLILSQLTQEDGDLIITNVFFDQIVYSLGLPFDDNAFYHLINSTLQRFQEDGRYDEIYARWFGLTASPDSQDIFMNTWSGSWDYTLTDSPDKIDHLVRSRTEDILQNHRLVAGVMFDMAPFGALDENNQLSGFEIDLVKEFAKRWTGDVNAVEFVPVTIANRIQKLVAGEVDLIAAAMPRHYQYAENIYFSQPYLQDSQSILIRENADINTLQELDKKVLAVIQDGIATDNIRQMSSKEGISFDILPFQEYPQALQALLAGQVDGLIGSTATLKQFRVQNKGLTLVDQNLMTLFYGFGVPHYDNRFQDLVNFTLQEMKLDGTYDRVYTRWFGEQEPFAMEIWSGNSYLELDMVPMIRIPAGQFIRGDQNGFPDEKPARSIYLDEYYIDQYEVTNRQYARCVQAGKCTLPRLPRSVNFTRYYAESSFGNSPVIWVDWNDAVNYCAFAGKRLPTEAEWEKAARGPENFFYPWSNDLPTNQANFGYLESDIVPIGSYAAGVSGYGVHDMAGNVREWVSDWYQWNYYGLDINQNPEGPQKGVTKVLRGGGWNDTNFYLKNTIRKNFLPNSSDSNLGFRCASPIFPPTR